MPARFRKRCRYPRPSCAHSAEAALLSDRVIIARSRDTSVLVRYLCWSSALRSPAPRIVTFTTLAESKRAVPLREHTSPSVGSSTQRATVPERPRRAAWMARVRPAASAGCDTDVQTTAGAVAVTAGAAGLAAAAA